MTDPRRLLEDGSAFERELLESASVDALSPARRRRLIATAAATGTALAAGTASGAGIATWKVLVGLAVLGSVAVAVTRAPRDEVVAVDPPPAAIAAPTIAAPPIAPSVFAPVPIASASAASSAPARKTVEASAASASVSASALRLAREVALIDAARAAVRTHDGPAALRAVDGYDREFAGGSLSVEAAVLRIEATALCGDAARASTLARAFLSAHPGSAYASRVNKHVLHE